VTITLEQADGAVRVSVKDTGVGLASEDAPHVFERFYQAQSGRGAKGSGIGLTIAKLWVEAHGGRIGVMSEGLGKGCGFWFTLPK